jgi:hypothetical protein
VVTITYRISAKLERIAIIPLFLTRFSGPV